MTAELNSHSKRRLKIIRDYAIGWVVAFMFLHCKRSRHRRTGKLKEGLIKESFINVFFRFKEQIKKREDHYQQQYGVVPFLRRAFTQAL